jgi:LysM repeat protein
MSELPAPSSPSPGHVHTGGGELDQLKGKLGPLPVWGWGLIGGVVIGGYMYYRKRKAAAATANTNAGSQYSGTNDSSNGGSAGELATTQGNAASGSNVTGTLAGWASQAVNWLIGQGSNPTDASNAISAYINGQTLTPAQETMVNNSLTEFGAPPSGVLPVNVATTTTTSTPVTTPDLSQSAYQAGPGAGLWASYQANIGSAANQTAYENGYNNWVYQQTNGASGAPTPAATPASAPAAAAAAAPAPAAAAATRKYTVQSGDTYFSVAQRFYGSSSSANVSKLEGANPYPARDIPVGAVLNIPS